MKEIQRKWNLISKEKREMVLREIGTYFKAEHDQEIGVIAAGDILDFFLETVGEEVYRKGIADAKTKMKEGMEDIEVNLELLVT